MQVKLHQVIVQPLVVDAMRGKRIIQRLAGDLPERCMSLHQRAQPGVFQLLEPPQFRDGICIRPDTLDAISATGACTLNKVP
jgi:hypothetical protein